MEETGMDDTLAYPQTLGALAEFIMDNECYLHPSEHRDEDRSYGNDVRAIITHLKRMRLTSVFRNDGFNGLRHRCMSLFLMRAPEVRDIFLPLSITGLAVSRESSFDPLTWTGLSDVTRFIENGLLDDDWLACYELDGVKRVVNEAVDDAVQSGKPIPASRLDVDGDWLRSARRTYLDHRSFDDLFGNLVPKPPPGVPDSTTLMELWMARPYADFAIDHDGKSLTTAGR